MSVTCVPGDQVTSSLSQRIGCVWKPELVLSNPVTVCFILLMIKGMNLLMLYSTSAEGL